LVINFFVPLEQAATHYFRQVLSDPTLNVSMTHKLDLESGGLKIEMLLKRADFNFLSTLVTFPEQQIMTLMQEHNITLQQMLGMGLSSACENMFMGLVKKFYEHYIETKLPKPKENATVDSEIQTHNTGGEENLQEAGNNSVSSN